MNDFKYFKEVYDYIEQNKLMTSSYICMYYRNSSKKNIIISRHALEQINKRFGEYYIEWVWECLSASENNINRLLSNKKNKSHTKKSKSTYNQERFTTHVTGIRSIWDIKECINNPMKKISLFDGSNEDFMAENNSLCLITVYYFDAIEKFCKRDRRKGK